MKQKTFDEKMKRLEEIVTMIEDSKRPLEEQIAFFKEGMALSRDCKNDLNKLEVEIQKVLSENADGTLKTEKFEPINNVD